MTTYSQNSCKFLRILIINFYRHSADLQKIIDVHFFNLLHLLKNGQKSDSFATHFEQHFKANTSCIDLCKYMTFKVVKQLKPIGSMKTFTKPNCNLCMEELLTILKKLHAKRVVVINKNSDIYGVCREKTTFH